MRSYLYALALGSFVAVLGSAQNYEGNHDTADCEAITGWALDANNPTNRITVSIYNGSTLVASGVVASQYRPDVAQASYGDGYSGFSYPTPASLQDGNPHQITVYFASTQTPLWSSPKTLTCSQTAPYTYYFSDTFPSSPNPTYWSVNGTVSGGSAGLTSSTTNGGSAISNVAVPGGNTEYMVRTTYRLPGGGGTYVTYLDATSNGLDGPADQGTFYAFELQNPSYTGGACSANVAIYKSVNGSVTLLASGTTACYDGMQTMAMRKGSTGEINVYLPNGGYLYTVDTAITSGQPGVGVRSAPANNGIAKVELGPPDTTKPPAVTGVLASPFSEHVDLRWQGVPDNSGGAGLWIYQVLRNGVSIANVTTPEFEDLNVTPSTSYTYAIYAQDYFLNYQPATQVNVTTPSTASRDPHRPGVRVLGPYWGDLGEQLDMQSGNLNYSIPLLKAQSRTNNTLALGLSYNSDNWRQDSAGDWNYGQDVGYGYGWKLQAGSITPYWENWWTVAYYLYTDSTGAQYKLNRNSGNVWTGTEGTFVSYDANRKILFFPNGVQWTMGDVSSGAEQDAGTLYPTIIQDTNGNQILLTYDVGVQAVGTSNSSSRITYIEDARAKPDPVIPNLRWTYRFTYFHGPYYTWIIPHLVSIVNSIGTSESFSARYADNQTLVSPITNNAVGSAQTISALSFSGLSLLYQFSYQAGQTQGTTGELTKVQLPRGGYLRWAHQSETFVDNRTYIEVGDRYLSVKGDGSDEAQYHLYRNTDTLTTVHSVVGLWDYTGNGNKSWFFITDPNQPSLGLPYQFQQRASTYSNTSLLQQAYTWSVEPNSGNLYLSANVETRDVGATYSVQKQTTQTIDSNGNVTARNHWDWIPATQSFSSTSTRKYAYTYGPFNSLASATVSQGNGAGAVTLVQNYFDGNTGSQSCGSFTVNGTQYFYTQIVPQTGMNEHASSYNSNYMPRGNVAASVYPGGFTCMAYDIGGTPVASNQNGLTVTNNINSQTNFVAPTQMTAGTMTPVSFGWTSFMGLKSQTGMNNGVTTFTYDLTSGRPTQSQTPTAFPVISIRTSPTTMRRIKLGPKSRQARML